MNFSYPFWEVEGLYSRLLVCKLRFTVFLLNLAEKKDKNVADRVDFNKVQGTQPQAPSVSVHTSRVTYGGIDGAYYTSTRTRRAGGDGVSSSILGFDMLFKFFLL